MSRRRAAGGEGGFTLVEVLIAVVIEAIIVGALGTAFVGILNSTTTVSRSLASSSDARIAAAYIVSDASNSSGPETSFSDTTSCAPSTLATGTLPAVRFTWTGSGSNGAPTAYIVNYLKVPNATQVGSYTLVRWKCVGSSPAVSDPVATNVASIGFGCPPATDCSGAPASITVTITEMPVTGSAALCVTTPTLCYTYSLTGAFKKLSGGGPPGPPQSVVLLGSGSACNGSTNSIDIQGGAKIRVYGSALINTADGASCKAMYLANGGAYQAGGTKFLQGGSCLAAGGLTCPPSTTYTPALGDPFAYLFPPTTTGLPSQTGCGGPGLYASGMQITSGTCTLATGVYVVQNGFGVSNGATLNAGAGVLIYLMSGQFNIGSANAVTITAQTSGAYRGIAVWQAAADTQQLVIGNGAGSVAINGVLYAPKGQLAINGGVLPSITQIVVQSLIINNGITLTVGSPSVPPLSITTASLPAWPVNTPSYSATLADTGGDGNEIWSVTTGALPAGLALNPSTGVISGKPTTVGTASFTVTLNDALGDNPDTQALSIAINPVPTVTATNPSSRGQGAPSQNIVITGTGFISGAGVSFSGSGITVSSTTVNSSTSLTANITIGAGATTGTRSVTVINPDTGVGIGTAVFTVNVGPNVISASPATRGQGATSQNIVITGTGFATGAGTAFSASGITVNSTTVNSATQITANVTIAPNAATGAGDVTVLNTDAGIDTQAGAFTVTAGPSVVSASPASRPQGTSGQNIVITGTGFAAGAVVSFSGLGVTASSTTVNSATQITVTITIAAGAATGARDVTVANVDAGLDAQTGAFTVNATPTVTSTSPAARGQGAVSQNIVITGSGFASGAGASFGSNITVNSTTFNSTTSLTANVTIVGATTGSRNVTVINVDTGVGVGTNVFTVNPAPGVSSASPAARGQGAANQNIVITGSGFVSGAAASFSGAGITVSSTTWNSATQVTATVTVAAGATIGAGDVTVTNPDAGVGTGAGKFTVNGRPNLISVSPASRPQGATSQSIVLTGAGFVSGATASFSGSNITVNSTTVNSATQATVVITISAGATTGARDVTLTNPDAGLDTEIGLFTVNAAPTVASTSPSSRPQGAASQNITINGSGFVTGAGSSFSGSNVTVNSTTFVSSSQLTANITISSIAAVGARDVTVVNPDSGVGVGIGVFTVNALPAVTSTSPASRGQGAVAQNITITGAGFLSGAAATFSGAGITVSSTTFVSATSLTAGISIAAGTTIGVRNVTVTNPDTGVATGTGVFTVNTAPTVTSTSPASRGQGAASQSIPITGTGFVSGAALATSFSGTGITVLATTWNSATQVTAVVSIAATATTGARDVTVTNGDAGVGTGTGKFTVNTGPNVVSASPTSRGQGAASQNIVLTGTGFVTGALASFSGTGITVVSTTVNNATTTTVVVTVAAGATIGARDVTLTNPDAGLDTELGLFTVNTAPTVASTSPTSRGQGAVSQTITVTGSGFVTGALASFGANITTNSTNVVSSTSLTANITIAVGAATGVRNVTVTNPDAGVGVGTGVFTVNTGPTVTSIGPTSRGQGAVSQSIVITGTGFVSGTGLAASFSGTGITVNSTTWNSATQVTAVVTIAANATIGARAVTVTNPDAGAGTLAAAFTVNAAPTLTSVLPTSGAHNTTGLSVVVTGTGFLSGANLAAAFSGSGITVTGISVTTGTTKVTIVINIANNAATGARTITLTNGDGGVSPGTVTFTVT
jgi:Tfp pilus assembly protein PilV